MQIRSVKASPCCGRWFGCIGASKRSRQSAPTWQSRRLGVHIGVLLARAHLPMQLQTQVTDPEAMRHVAGSLGIGRVVALLGALLALLQRLDRRIYVLHPQLSQRLPHRVHQRRAHPRRAGGLINTLQGPKQCLFADQLVHAQRLCAHRVPAQRGDVGIAPVPGKHPHHQRAQHITFVWRVVASVANGQAQTQRSNTPVAAKNSAKNTSWPAEPLRWTRQADCRHQQLCI